MKPENFIVGAEHVSVKSPSEKTCTKCGETKPLEDFYKNHQGKLGRQSQCKPCHRESLRKWRAENGEKIRACKQGYRAKHKERYLEYQRKWRSDNQEHFRAYKQSYLAKNKEYIQEYTRKWRAENGEKLDAHKAVRLALRKGSLVRPDRCSQCGKKCTPEGHHDDYAKPLEVRWLCRSCHKLHHTCLKKSRKAA